MTKFKNLTSIQYLYLFYHLQPSFINYASNVLYTVQGGAVVKEMVVQVQEMQEIWVQALGWEEPPE